MRSDAAIIFSFSEVGANVEASISGSAVLPLVVQNNDSLSLGNFSLGADNQLDSGVSGDIVDIYGGGTFFSSGLNGAPDVSTGESNRISYNTTLLIVSDENLAPGATISPTGTFTWTGTTIDALFAAPDKGIGTYTVYQFSNYDATLAPENRIDFAFPAVGTIWDIDGATAGGSGTDSGDGNWSDTTWSLNPLGTDATGGWYNNGTTGNVATFSAGDDVTGSSTITADESGVVLTGIKVEEGAVTINGLESLALNEAPTGTDEGSSEAAEIDVAAGSSLIIATTLTNDGSGGDGVEKTGDGILTLSEANTYDGGTTVSGGTLLVNNTSGSGVGSGSLTVSNGTLGGDGSIAGATTIGTGSFLSPGATAGVVGDLVFGADLDISGLTGDNNGGLLFDLAGGGSDQVSLLAGAQLIMGTLDFEDFTFTDLGGLSDGDTITLFDNLELIAGSIGNSQGTIGSLSAEIFLGDNGNDILLRLQSEPFPIFGGAPEPSRVLLLLLGAVSVVLRRRRKPLPS